MPTLTVHQWAICLFLLKGWFSAISATFYRCVSSFLEMLNVLWLWLVSQIHPLQRWWLMTQWQTPQEQHLAMFNTCILSVYCSNDTSPLWTRVQQCSIIYISTTTTTTHKVTPVATCKYILKKPEVNYLIHYLFSTTFFLKIHTKMLLKPHYLLTVVHVNMTMYLRCSFIDMMLLYLF